MCSRIVFTFQNIFQHRKSFCFLGNLRIRVIIIPLLFTVMYSVSFLDSRFRQLLISVSLNFCVVDSKGFRISRHLIMEQGGAAGAHDEEGRGDSRFVSSDRRSSRQNVSDPVMIPQLCFKNPGTVNIEKIEDGSLEAPGGTEDDVMSIPVVETVDSQAKMEEAGNSESERETVQIEEMQTHFEDEGTKIPAKFGTGTQTKRHCEKEGHICFDCFPIPDTLLDQLKNQTGLNKLACLQAVQTVVRFYKVGFLFHYTRTVAFSSFFSCCVLISIMNF